MSILLIAIAIIGYGSLAYFTASKVAHNTISVGNIDIELLNWADEARQEEFQSDDMVVMPNTEIVKIVEVKNTSLEDAYIRVKLDSAIALSNTAEMEDMGLVSVDINTTNWKLQDGYYYYTSPLSGGEVTVPLYTKVAFSKKMSNIYDNSTLQLDAHAYAVQVANNGEDALTADGWPEVPQIHNGQGE